MDTRLQQEVQRRTERGYPPITLAELEKTLRSIGYRIDRSYDTAYNARYMTGDLAGVTYPAISILLVEADTGKSFSHFEARRDANFEALQRMRYEQSHYVILKRGILDI